MPRFKTPDYGLKLIPVDFAQQVLPGTFERARPSGRHLCRPDRTAPPLRCNTSRQRHRIRASGGITGGATTSA
ncbi:hypothetical protein METUNv1_03187 [Methyloversatilis universalis FAM5]|uniref:Uncharacterized protein n=1 Tax=Methyloversatilis universalis (strain ATCC BAA-1314 / DSM 25237 / JCM 13912 / CCUG 52030 / FAM5) TaxID=1000565 RepID=F5RG91_METUF|nr:hypothetical protein METUNv1_03187 [Methyloversatilis universalis FAM5]